MISFINISNLPTRRSLLWAIPLAIVTGLGLVACPSPAPTQALAPTPAPVQAQAQTVTPTASRSLSGRVLSTAGTPVAGATIYLVDIRAIDMTRMTGSDVYKPPYPAEVYDEPLEDAIRLKGKDFTTAMTDSEGRFSIPEVPNGKFFIHVTPASGDIENLPGGDKSRASVSAEQLRGQTMNITVSSSPSQDATYIGTSACLTCHKKYETEKQTGHKLSWMPVGAPGRLQDPVRFPEIFKSLTAFTELDDYTKGTHLEFGDFDARRGGDKFKLREFNDSRLPIATIYGDVYLWKSKSDGKHYITMVNRLNPKDSNGISHIEVKMTYGGMVGRQRFIVTVPPNLGERPGWYVLLEYHPDANDTRLDRSRRVWMDFEMSLWWSAGKDDKFGTQDDEIKAPPVNTNTIQAMCAGCHVTGHERYKDSATGQLLVRAVDDPNGELNIDDDPSPDEINIGCENCHGPGSKHIQNGGSHRYIVSPKYLAAERSSVICGRCHDRRQGIGGSVAGYTQAINEKGQIMRPGGSRALMLTEYTDAIKKGPRPGQEIWDDDVHSKFPHQQYADFIKSKMYRNDRILVTCSDCHDIHGGTPYRRWLIHDPDKAKSPLCQRCHTVDLLSHIETKLGAKMKGEAITRCIDCHMPGTMSSGPGVGAVTYGKLIETPPYKNADEEAKNAYWQGSIRSHVFDMPQKTNIGVRGKRPGDAMPVPYTNSCGVCHVVKELPYK